MRKDLKEALEALEIDASAGPVAQKDVITQWRKILIRDKIHPDHGGDPEIFQRMLGFQRTALRGAYACVRCLDKGTVEIRSGFRRVSLLCGCKKVRKG